MQAAGVSVGIMLALFASWPQIAAAACCRNYEEYADFCRNQGGIPSKNPLRCSPKPTPPPTSAPPPTSIPSNAPPGRDYEAERREQDAASAEAERQAEARRVKEEAEKQAAFIRSRDAAASTLKGSVGAPASPNGGLKGSSDYGLKDAVKDPGLRGSATTSSAEQSKQALAWKQLHCAASIAKYALSALQVNGDTAEFGVLQVEAFKALDGQRPSVECGNAPPFPDARGKTIDLERVKAAERQVLERAGSIAERMKQRQPAAQPAAPAGPETPEEKLRRVQKELNAVNSQKISGKTQKEIDQQEKDRKDLAKLVLVNNGLEKGDFTSVAATVEDTARKPRGRREPPAPAAAP